MPGASLGLTPWSLRLCAYHLSGVGEGTSYSLLATCNPRQSLQWRFIVVPIYDTFHHPKCIHNAYFDVCRRISRSNRLNTAVPYIHSISPISIRVLCVLREKARLRDTMYDSNIVCRTMWRDVLWGGYWRCSKHYDCTIGKRLRCMRRRCVAASR